MPKEIVTGVVLTSLTVAVSAHLPIIGFFSALLIPIPVLFYRAKLGRANGALVPLGTLLILAAMMGRLSVDVLVFSELMLLGFLLAELFELNLPVEKTVGYACGAVLTTAAACVFVFGSASGSGVTGMVSAYVVKNLELTLALYERMGLLEENIRIFSESLDQIAYVLVRVIPAFAVVSSLFVAWTSLLIARPILVGRNLKYPDFGRLNLWKAPDPLVWGVIGCGAMVLLGGKGLKLIGLNGLLMLMTVYFFQGIAVISFLFHKKGFPRMLRVFLYSLIALQQIVLLLVIGCGFFDTWFNFRRLNVEKTV